MANGLQDKTRWNLNKSSDFVGKPKLVTSAHFGRYQTWAFCVDDRITCDVLNSLLSNLLCLVYVFFIQLTEIQNKNLAQG